jgi:ATP-dependent Clp protease ATP-binding subunit ClpA
MTCKEYYQNIGLDEFPFNTFTTKDESEIASNIFISQVEYDPILDIFKKFKKIIIIGERGSEKTAILEGFKRHLDKKIKYLQLSMIFQGLLGNQTIKESII